MNLEAKITSKGQITVPLKVRRDLGLKAGDKITFDKNSDDEIVLRPARKGSPFAKYRGIGNPGIDSGLEAINKHVREMRGFDPDDSCIG